MTAAVREDLDLAPALVRASGEQFARAAADLLERVIAGKPDAVLGVATGDTPVPVYAELARRRTLGLRTDLLTLVALDEYVGLDPADARSYQHYVREEIAAPLGIPFGNVHVPSGLSETAGDDYERLILSLGGVDLQVVGIGRNGHIGFNEPGAEVTSRTRRVELAESTRRANAGFFGGDPEAVPTHAVTQGIATILSAREIVLLARGAGKAEAVAAAVHGEISSAVPASFLRRHAQVTAVIDDDAGGMLA